MGTVPHDPDPSAVVAEQLKRILAEVNDIALRSQRLADDAYEALVDLHQAQEKADVRAHYESLEHEVAS